jgi:hypothetical protein
MSKNNTQVFVLRIKAWDGSRIVGVFKDAASAHAVQRSFLNENKEDARLNEEFELDVIEMGRLSIGSNITIGSPTTNNSSMLTRNHIYDD